MTNTTERIGRAVAEVHREYREGTGHFAPINPKDKAAAAEGKPRLDLLEPVAERDIAKALAFGADKYGVRNFVTASINARVYVAAMKRHIDAWLDGEDYAEDSGVHHLGHVGANVHVALAAIAAGTFVDDRGVSEAKDTSISDPAKVEQA